MVEWRPKSCSFLGHLGPGQTKSSPEQTKRREIKQRRHQEHQERRRVPIRENLEDARLQENVDGSPDTEIDADQTDVGECLHDAKVVDVA